VVAVTAALMQPRRLEATRGWAFPSLSVFGHFRDLLVVLAAREFKPRYRQTLLGVVWVLLQPVAGALVFGLIFGGFGRLPSDGLPYFLFAYTGLVVWNFFSGAVTRAGYSLIGNPVLVTKVALPRILIPTSSMLLGYIDVLVSLLLLGVMLVAVHLAPTWNLLFLPLCLVLLSVVTFGVGLWMAALNAYYRDFIYALPVLLQIWMFATPVVYSSVLFPPRFRALIALNPLVGCVEGFRYAILGRSSLTRADVLGSCLVGVFIAVTGLLVFRRVERAIADRI
jgi:lipopolysaccharide transport system permease protein